MTRQNIASGGPFEDIYGYCRAVRVGDTVHVAGTCAAVDDLDDSLAGDATSYDQAVSALKIIEGALTEAGASFADVVRTITYVTNIEEWEQIARAHSEVFDAIRPASTLLEVSRLIDPRMVVEIEVYAQIAN